MSDKVRQADLVMVGSYVPEGVEVGRWVCRNASATAFYDIDTPVTLHKLRTADYEYLHPDLIPRYDIYFSFTGGGTLQSSGAGLWLAVRPGSVLLGRSGRILPAGYRAGI